MDHKVWADVQQGRWVDYWRRDAVRFGQAATLPTPGLWAFGWGRVSRKAAVAVGCGVGGLAIGLVSAEAMLRLGASPGWVGVLLVLAWGPWMLGCLGLIHLLRAWRLGTLVPESDGDFVTATGEDESMARAVRRALAEVYGVHPSLIRSSDTGHDLSGWMESPTGEEFCAAFLRVWGSGKSPAMLARRVGPVTATDTVATLTRRTAAALRIGG